MRDFLQGRVAQWWMPDDVLFVDAILHTATGKIHKLAVRQRSQNHLLAALPPATENA